MALGLRSWTKACGLYRKFAGSLVHILDTTERTSYETDRPYPSAQTFDVNIPLLPGKYVTFSDLASLD